MNPPSRQLERSHLDDRHAHAERPVDEFAVYKAALTAAELEQIYRQGKP